MKIRCINILIVVKVVFIKPNSEVVSFVHYIQASRVNAKLIFLLGKPFKFRKSNAINKHTKKIISQYNKQINHTTMERKTTQSEYNKQVNHTTMERKTTQSEKNVELLNQLIANGYNNLTTKELYEVVQNWIADITDKNSPVSYLGEDLFLNYLYYLAINIFDGLINNKAHFIPSQNYAQEYNRVIRGYILGVHNESNDEDDFTLDFSNHKLCFGKDADFNEEFQKSTVPCKAVQYFDDTFIKSILDDKTYNNFTKYCELFLIDTIYNNACSFRVSQNYEQELFRQSKAPELISLVNSDWHLVELIYLIDCAIQDRFLRKLKKSAPTEITCEIKKIW